MTFDEMSNLLNRLEHLDCVFFHNYMMQERKELQPLYKRLALFYDEDDTLKQILKHFFHHILNLLKNLMINIKYVCKNI